MIKNLLYTVIAILGMTFPLFSQIGFTCSNPIQISSLPYQTIDNTANYGNTLAGPQGANCAGSTTTNYLSGNDVFYSYTPLNSGFVTITMTPTGTRSSLFVYSSCPSEEAACLAGVANTASAVREIYNLAVTSGITYTIVVSSNALTPTIGYDLIIQEETCYKPINLVANQTTLNGATLTWQENGTATSWQIAVQPAGMSIPTGPGQYTANTNTNFVINDLNPGILHQFWVRSECSPDVFSGWSGPYTFSTQICEPADQCTYTFRMTDTANNGWNGSRMQIRQNGIVVVTIGSTYNSGTGPVDVQVALCNDIPFDVFWSVPGSQPQQCVVTVLNSFGQQLFTATPAMGTPGEVVYSDIVNCDTPQCNVTPTNIVITENTLNNTSIHWSGVGADSWSIYVTPVGSPQPTAATIPTYTTIQQNSYTITDLLEDTAYQVYVTPNCPGGAVAWSAPTTVTTLASCNKPTNPTVQNITTTSAVLGWTPYQAVDNSFEILLVPSIDNTVPNTLPPDIPSQFDGSILIPYTGTNASIQTNDLTPATFYLYYIRTICSENEKSNWSNPYVFNTLTCAPEDKCIFKFALTDAGNNGWTGGRMQVRQNGILIATLGQTLSTGAVPQMINVAICGDVPFDLYWSVAGAAPQEVGIAIIDPFGDTIFTKLPGEGTPLSVVYADNELGNCVPPTCARPSNLTVNTIGVSQTSAQLAWIENGTANQWEVLVTPLGSPFPINGSAVSGAIPFYLTSANPFTVTGLTPGVAYEFYVRALCAETATSTWSVNPATFVTNIVNDDCESAISVPVNPGVEGDLFVSGSTFGGTASGLDTSCAGMENDDVWFEFVATSPNQLINIFDVTGTTTDINHALFTGSACESMTLLYCSSDNSSFATGLTIGQTYRIMVYTEGNNVNESANFKLTIGSSGATSPANDEVINALEIPVNSGIACVSSVYGSLTAATASVGVASTCPGLEDDDVWFVFTAASSSHALSILDVVGSTSNVKHAVYSGTVGNLTQLYCSPTTFLHSTFHQYVVGQDYYVRVWSNEETPQVAHFSICVKTISTCQNPDPFCGSSVDDPFVFSNTTGIPNATQVACLGSIPNPTYYVLKVAEPGTLVYNITQNTSFDVNGNPIGNALDVDFAAWGPFDSAESCDEISFTDCPTCPSNTTNPSFYPLDNIIDCSYSASFTETVTIPNTLTGQYYLLLITNFNGNSGYIKLTQTNTDEPNAGSTLCEDKAQLVAFLDMNSNNIKDADETNFTYGAFVYQKNNSGPTSVVSSPQGKLSLYDSNPANTYDFGYQLDSEYAPYYALSPTNFNDVNITVGSGSQMFYFPVTLTQPYSDVSVAIIPVGAPPRPGFTYANNIIYRNTGVTPASGTLSFTKDPSVAILSVTESGTVNTTDGFSYAYTNLMPAETRSFVVYMSVPTIPTVNLGDVLTNAVASTIPDGDMNVTNNNFSLSQTVVGSYDPNDKMEAHGESVDFTTFTADDYLVYTIRFQNTGTADAISVRIEDVLDDQLDEESVRMVSASHNYVMERINNKLIWTFDDIQLPPQMINDDASQGYVTFKIKPNPGFAIGDIIPNFAEIYFDTNPPIITNTFNSEFQVPLSTKEFTSANIMLYPNPSNGMVQISILNSTETLNSVSLYDVVGKKVMAFDNINAAQSTLHVGSLAKGMYMVEIMTQNHERQTKKLVVN